MSAAEASFYQHEFTPRGEVFGELGLQFTPLLTPRGEYSVLFRKRRGTHRVSVGDNLTLKG
jgi:hypothetical protein